MGESWIRVRAELPRAFRKTVCFRKCPRPSKRCNAALSPFLPRTCLHLSAYAGFLGEGPAFLKIRSKENLCQDSNMGCPCAIRSFGKARVCSPCQFAVVFFHNFSPPRVGHATIPDGKLGYRQSFPRAYLSKPPGFWSCILLASSVFIGKVRQDGKATQPS